MDALEAEIAGLARLSAHELRIAWRKLGCGEPSVGTSRNLLMREIAYKLQERARGGLAPAIKRRLRSLAEEIAAGGGGSLALPIALKPGTRLMREWGGHTHTVVVLDDGFEYDGEHHRSLTQIARRITGAHWSGPRFFGLRAAPVQRADEAADA